MTRYAVYYAPQQDDPLWQAGCAWLGRDPAGGVLAPGPEVSEQITAEAGRYGFHATLKPPMRLRAGCVHADVLDALHEAAAGIPSFQLPQLAVTNWHGFLCLRETTPSPELQAMADACVAGLDHLRAAPGVDELARRRAGGLSPAQDANLRRWGYPQVFATWFFHMTLTSRLDAEQAAVLQAVAEKWFHPALARRRIVSDVCLFMQRAPETPFMLEARVECG